MPESEVVRVANAFRAALLRQEEAQMREMAARWVTVRRRLDRQIDEVLREIAQREAHGEVFGAHEGPYARLERYQALVAQSRVEVGKYAAWVGEQVTAQQQALAGQAAADSVALLQSVLREGGGVALSFDRLPAEVMENMAVYLSDDAPLRQLLSQAWPDAVVRMTDALMEGVALGRAPRETARAMADGMAQGVLQRCLTIARTEQLRAYREATLASYRASGVVSGYKRLAAKSARTCLACLLEDGKECSLDEPFDEHPRGRCCSIPCIIGMKTPAWQTGREWLLEQPEAVQKEVMGLARWDLWRAGQVGLDEMVERHEHPVWGGSLGVRPVGSLPGGA